VKTANLILMCDMKASNETPSSEAPEKGLASADYCCTASEWNSINCSKLWGYAIVADSSIQPNPTFQHLIATCSPLEIMIDEQSTQLCQLQGMKTKSRVYI
jgi:hypothetical protein